MTAEQVDKFDAGTGRTIIGFPCHHPDWPVYCPNCRKQVDGFTVSLYLPQLPPNQRWGTFGASCDACQLIALPKSEYVDKVAVAVKSATRTLDSKFQIIIVNQHLIESPETFVPLPPAPT